MNSSDAISRPNGQESLSTLWLWGKSFLRNGETLKAEAYLSRAIAKFEASTNEFLSTTWLMDLLEGRAAAREKNNRVEEALADANRMLKLEKSNPRGYICLGRLLETKKKPKSALKCYAYGLTQCAQSHESFLGLVKAQKAVEELISYNEKIKTLRDPVSVFPHEILTMVFKYISFREVMKCHRVSRNWQTFLSSEPALYRTIELFSLRKPLRAESIKRLIHLSNNGVGTKEIAVSSMGHSFANYCVPGQPQYKSQTITLLQQLFKNLKSISIGSCDSPSIGDAVSWKMGLLNHEFDILPLANLVHIDIGYTISVESFARLCQETPHLESLSCSLYWHEGALQSERSFPQLKTLTLLVSITDNQLLQSCVRWFYNLETLTVKCNFAFEHSERLEWECGLEKLKTLKLVGNTLIIRGLQCVSTNLRVLDISGLIYLKTLRVAPQTRLEELHIHSVPDLRGDTLLQFYDSAESLRHLTISSPNFGAKDIQHFLVQGRNLRTIKINSMESFTDSTLAILHSMHHLERLEIDHCPLVTGGGIINLVQSLCTKTGGKLRSISLRGSESIRRQTIDWARDQGVIISI